MLKAIVALVLVLQLVAAVQVPDNDAQHGVTILKPNGGDSAHGVTVMSAGGSSAATSACSTGNCQQQQAPASNQGPAVTTVSSSTGKPMHAALIHHRANACGCPEEDEACACNKPQFVAPEIKAEPCGCQGQVDCACHSAQLVQDECGCLHLEVCGCRKSSVEPETRENTVVPELHDAPVAVSTCGCQDQDTACACNKPKFVAPEIKVEPCGCQQEETCACRSSAPAPVSVSTDECGCLHLTECGCRRPTVEPETRENTVVPEVRDTMVTTSTCGCQQEDTACACNKPQFVAPEIKAEPCACQDQVEVECGCSHFRPNF